MAQQTIWMIGVNYNNDDETVRFCNDVARQVGESDLQVAIVDNSRGLACNEQSLGSRLSGFPRVTVLTPTENLGYFGGANWALEVLGIRDHVPDWVIVCNTDLVLCDSQFGQKLVTLDDTDRADVIAPSIYSERTGLDQNPMLRVRPGTFSVQMEKWILRYRATQALACWIAATKSRIRGAVCRKRAGAPRRTNASEDIYAPHGSFIIFGARYFQKGGDLRHGTFLYAEEILVAETARSLGLRIRYVPALEVRHFEHISVSASPHTGRYQADAAAYCADRYFPLLHSSGARNTSSTDR